MWLTLATTSLVVVALLVPMGLILRQEANDNTRRSAESLADSYAEAVALALSVGAGPIELEAALTTAGDGVLIYPPQGDAIGRRIDGQGTLVDLAVTSESTISAFINGGYEIAVPILTNDGTTVVDVFVTNSDLVSGILDTWLLMAGLGIVLIAGAVWASSLLGQRLVEPIDELSMAAQRMSAGDLSTRVRPTGPPEVERLGRSFNILTGRLDDLLTAERESIADMSHRLRTPIAALRLKADALPDEGERRVINSQIDRLEREVDSLISASRAKGDAPAQPCDLNRVVAERAEFWRVLAVEQNRTLEVEVGEKPLEVSLGRGDVLEALDVLVENVFSHTDLGIGLTISTGSDNDVGWFQVADRGSGFTNVSVVTRGVSGDGSTGLGLDIVRRIATKGGGGIEIHNRPGEDSSGAVVRVMFSLAG